MELNEFHTEHEQATTTLKVVLLVFAIVLVGTLAYLVGASNNAPDTTDNSGVVVKKSTGTTATTTAVSTANWKTCPITVTSISVKYPPSYVCGQVPGFDGGSIFITRGLNQEEDGLFNVQIDLSEWGQDLSLENGKDGGKTIKVSNFDDLKVWAGNQTAQTPDNEIAFDSTRVTTLAGIKCVLNTYVDKPSNSTNLSYWVDGKDGFYHVSYSYYTNPTINSQKNLNAVFEKVVGTFTETK